MSVEPDRALLLWQVRDLIGHYATERLWWAAIDPRWAAYHAALERVREAAAGHGGGGTPATR